MSRHRAKRLGLTAEAVEGAALALEGIDDVHGGDGLAAGVLSAGVGVPDDALEEHLERAAGLLVDQPRVALHAASPCLPSDRRGRRRALDSIYRRGRAVCNRQMGWLF
ncbi:hypothetical protein MUK42_07871 [Musa troglodytarum]|uniref:Uncharacterized protein n=1 Tax=Musa troglodytarum TaxID=320322 RepID=A0A9E7G4K2_9LILI|nr:hypothetical protein MUK42_07871 [Musa troglodytarum]